MIVQLFAPNYPAVIAAAVVSMIIGMTWYSRAVFGLHWLKLMGWSPDTAQRQSSKDMAWGMVIAAIAALVFAAALDQLAIWSGVNTLGGGVALGAFLWLGVLLPFMVGGVLWEKKPWALFWLNAAYQLVNFAVMGAIIAGWGQWF